MKSETKETLIEKISSLSEEDAEFILTFIEDLMG